MPAAPKVFISYSHDGEAHELRVLDLANRLRDGGIDTSIDQYEQFPENRWPAWCKQQIEEATHILLVCTEIYRRRMDGKEEEGSGLGVCWEAPIIQQLLYNAGSRGRKLVPVLFADGSIDHIPLEIGGFSQFWVDDEASFEDLLRFILTKPRTPKPPLGSPPELPPDPRPRLAGAGRVAGGGAQPAPPPTQADRLFVGREGELGALAALLLSASGGRQPVVVAGMPGVGKSYLIDRCFAEHAADFPGGYVRVSLDAEAPPALDELMAQIAARLKLPAGDAASLAARLGAPLTLLHVENIDGKEAGCVAAALAAALPGSALVFSARHQWVGTAAGWGQVRMEPFADAEAREQLRAELGVDAPHQDAWPELAAALGRLPLALHLAAGHLRFGDSPSVFLRRLRAKGLALDYVDPADPVFRDRSRALLNDTFDLSIRLLHREGRDDGDAWVGGLQALGCGTLAGFGGSLGAAIAGLEPEVFDEMARAAAALSLLERRPDEKGVRLRLHPLLAELGRARASHDAAVARITDWFCARLPKAETGYVGRWGEVHAEIASLIEWLPHVPKRDRAKVERAGSQFAIACGPFEAWLRFCEGMLADSLSERELSDVLWTLANITLMAGRPDRALVLAKEKESVDRRNGEEREVGLALGLIADIYVKVGKLDEAWQISSEEQLSIYYKLNDTREYIVTKSRMADILMKRGHIVEALSIWNDLPISALKDMNLRAKIRTKVAECYEHREELSNALRIYSEEVLPNFEELGSYRDIAVTKARILNIKHNMGHRNEDRLAEEEELLMIFENLGDLREIALTRANIGNEKAQRGEVDEAILIYSNGVIPQLLRSKNFSELVVARWYLATHYLRRGGPNDRTAAKLQLCSALFEARKRQLLTCASQILQTLQQHGMTCD